MVLDITNVNEFSFNDVEFTKESAYITIKFAYFILIIYANAKSLQFLRTNIFKNVFFSILQGLFIAYIPVIQLIIC